MKGFPGRYNDDNDSNKSLVIHTGFRVFFFFNTHLLGTCCVLGTILGAEDAKMSKRYPLGLKKFSLFSESLLGLKKLIG